MQFSVPQFTEVEDKIIGPLTLRQFLILLGGGGAIVLMFRLIPIFIVFIVLALPVVAFAAFAAFGSYNGKSLGELILWGLNFFAEPTSYIFHRETKLFSHPAKKKPAPSLPAGPESALTREEKMSRLRKLTYILDQDIKAEEELLKEKYVHLK